MITGDPIEAFESYLETALFRLDPMTPLSAMLRQHFGVDAPGSTRGKRLRPRILLAVAMSEGAPADAAFGAAAAVELLHNYSLVHDDIEDRDELRHGRPTLWSLHGVASAIEAGNALSALSHLTLIDAMIGRDPDAVVAMALCLQRTVHAMCDGQALDLGFETATHVGFDDYLAMIEGKTAALFAASCELGARAAGIDGERAPAYGRVGRAYGLSFQIRDDVLGTWGSTAQTGKPCGADIRRRKWSFPVAWALAGPPSAERDAIAAAYATVGCIDDQRVATVIDALDVLGARAAADAHVARLIAEANDAAATHGLDRDGRLREIFETTAKRLV